MTQLLSGDMIKGMSREAALFNAQSVWGWATMFGHGSIIELTSFTTDVTLSVHFPYSDFDKDREDQKYRSVVMAGAKFHWTDRPDLQIWTLHIEWHFETKSP